MKNELFKKLILEMDATMKAVSTCLVDMEKKVAFPETENELPAKSLAKLLSSSAWSEAKSARTEESFIETFSPTYLEIRFSS